MVMQPFPELLGLTRAMNGITCVQAEKINFYLFLVLQRPSIIDGKIMFVACVRK